MAISFNRTIRYIVAACLLLFCIALPSSTENKPIGIVKVISKFSEAIDSYQKSRFQAAIDTYEQALISSRDAGDYITEINSLYNLGFIYFSLGEKNKTEKYIKEFLKVPEGKTLDAFEQHSYPAKEYFEGFETNDYIKLLNRVEYLEQILHISRSLGYKLQEARLASILGILGNDYSRLENFKKADYYYQQSFAAAQALKPEVSLKIPTACEGFHGMWTLSLKCAQQTLSIYKKLKNKDKTTEAGILSNIGQIYGILGDHDSEARYLEQAVAACQGIPQCGYHSDGLYETDLAFSYFRTGKYNKAITSCLIGIEKSNGNGNTFIQRLGNVYQVIGENKKAIEYYQKLTKQRYFAEKVSTSHGGSVLFDLASAFLDSGNLGAAEQILKSSIEAYERQNPPLPSRSSIGSIEIGDAVLNSYPRFIGQIRPYSLLQQALVRQNKSLAALEVSDRIRSRLAVATLFGRIHFPQMFQSGGKTSDDFPLDYKEFQLLGKRIAENPINIDKIKQIAKEQNATLVEYSIIHDDKAFLRAEAKIADIYIWVVQPNGEITFRHANFKPIQVDKNNSLEKLVNTTIQSVIGARSSNNSSLPSFTAGEFVKMKDDTPNWEPWQVVAFNPQYNTLTLKLSSWADTDQTIERPIADVAEKVRSNRVNEVNLQLLHQVLIDPIANLLPADPNAKVIFIPHGDLFLIPFSALQSADGKYLIEKHTISISPSIQLLQLTRQQHHRINGKAKNSIAVGNPTMSKTPISWRNKFLHPLAQLPQSEQEAQTIAQLLNSSAITGDRATKDFVVSQMSDAKIIHFATHAILDDGDLLSPNAILLAFTSKDDGLLTASEILKLNLHAELVVMSACNTARGTILGDGVIGLARSFIVAGVPSVIGSLWSVPDSPTAELMTEFYRNLQKHFDKAQALRQAMLTTMKTHPAPRDWAAFTLIGETD